MMSLEEHSQRAREVEVTGRVAAHIAHDLGNMLAPITMSCYLLKKKLPADHPAVQYCDMIQRSTEGIAQFGQALRALGQPASPNSQPTDLNKIVAEAVARIPDRPETLAIELRLAPAPCPISASAEQMKQVVGHLLTNAREAMQDQGVLTVGTDIFSSDRAFGFHSRVEAGEYARLSVSDTGAGIPSDITGRIFDPFFTTKGRGPRHGSGLGLSIVNALVGNHSGYVDLSSEPGKGTSFFVYIPAHAGGTPAPPVEGHERTGDPPAVQA